MQNAVELDAMDPLAPLRAEFHVPSPDKPVTYLCGHSLGLQPRRARILLQEELDAWQQLGVEAHFTGRRPWMPYHEQLTRGLALLAGARPQEVVAMNGLSVNLHLLLASFYRPTRDRFKILIERGAFPSDRYAVVSQIKWHGLDPANALIELGPREGESAVREEDVYACLQRDGASIATVLWPGVQYLTGQRFDVAAIAAAARARGSTVGFDLAHAIGNVPLALHDSEVDFAAWCGYKYLNGGPGAIGGAFVHERHARAFDLPRLAGWWGHDPTSRFTMPQEFAPQPGAAGWQVSNPPIFSAAPLIASLEIFSRVGMEALRAKSLKLTSLLRGRLAADLPQVNILTPPDPREYGCQVSMSFDLSAPQLSRLRTELESARVLGDWREPNVLRVAPVPLYNTFADVANFIDALKSALAA